MTVTSEPRDDKAINEDEAITELRRLREASDPAQAKAYTEQFPVLGEVEEEDGDTIALGIPRKG